jgi:hypothetical protein
MDSGSGLPQAPLSFEQQNTKLPDVISLSPYFEPSSIISVGTLYKRIVTPPRVHSLTLRPFGWLGFKTTLILNHAIVRRD